MWIKQGMEPFRPICELAFELSGQLRQSFQPVGDGYSVSCPGMASPGTSG
jgi:hypothetical protein